MPLIHAKVGSIESRSLTIDTINRHAAKRQHADVTHGRFLQLVPNRQIVQSVRFESNDPRFAGEMRMTWLLEGGPEGTTVSIRADDVPGGIAHQDHLAGFQATLANLAAFVER
jgi:uncharacterized protein YndB with AHSA1/START domain